MLMSDEGHIQRQTQGGYNSSRGHLVQMGQKHSNHFKDVLTV
jgi:hypothetical protein